MIIKLFEAILLFSSVPFSGCVLINNCLALPWLLNHVGSFGIFGWHSVCFSRIFHLLYRLYDLSSSKLFEFLSPSQCFYKLPSHWYLNIHNSCHFFWKLLLAHLHNLLVLQQKREMNSPRYDNGNLQFFYYCDHLMNRFFHYAP